MKLVRNSHWLKDMDIMRDVNLILGDIYKSSPVYQLYISTSQDGAEDGSRVACSGKTLQFFVCFISFFFVLRVRCC